MEGRDKLTLNEVLKILKTVQTVKKIDDLKEEIANIIPYIKNMFKYDQKNLVHQFDLWMHTLHTVINIPRNIDDDMLYLAALLHDIGKPASKKLGERNGKINMHYPGHPRKSMQIVRDAIIPDLENKGYKLSIDEKSRLLYYVEYHDALVARK